MKAIVIGATGATGKALLTQLLADSYFSEVVVLVRRKYFEPQPKLKEVVIDFDRIEDVADQITGDIAFSCMGTTLKTAGSKERQWEIDVNYPYRFATLAKANHMPSFVLLSGMTANEQSRIFYSRMKGALENKIKALSFSRLLIFQPGPLVRPNTDRIAEKISIPVLNILCHLGLFKNYRPLAVSDLASAMIRKVKLKGEAIERIPMKQILKLLH
jgi:uncharacterized protein YbjT (DUF2867 family)